MKKLMILLFALMATGSIFAAALNESFESTTCPAAGWTIRYENTAIPPINPMTHDVTNYEGYGRRSFRFSSENAANSYVQYLITPLLSVTAGDQTVSFWYRTARKAQSLFRFGTSTTDDAPESFTWNYHTSAYHTQWQQYTNTSLPIGTKYIAIKCIMPPENSLWLDSFVGPNVVVVDDPEPTSHVTNFMTSSVASASIKLTWTGSTGAQLPAKYLILAKKAAGTYATVADGMPVADDMDWSDDNAAINVVHANGANSCTIAGLSRSTLYSFIIYPFNNYGTLIDYKTNGIVPTATVSTADPTISSFPYLQNFDGIWSGTPAAPDGWMVVNRVSGTSTWRQSNDFISPPHSEPYPAAGTGNDDDYLISPPLDLTNIDVRMKWWDKVSQAGSPISYKVLLSTSTIHFSNFRVELANIVCTNDAWTEHTIDLSAYIGQTVYLAFYMYNYSPHSAWGFGIDDFVLEEIPTSPIISTNPNIWDFGSKIINTDNPKEFTISNIGIGLLDLSSVTVSGAGFALGESFVSNPLAYSETASFTVNFVPLAVGNYTGSVVINSNGGSSTIPLSGACFDPTISLPWLENFDTASIPALPYGWTMVNANNDAVVWETSTAAPRSAPNSLNMGYNLYQAKDDYAISPPLALTGGVSYGVEFFYCAAGSAPEKLKLMLGTNPTAASMNTLIFDLGQFSNNTYQRAFSIFIPPTTGSYFLGWYGYSAADMNSIYLDDISVSEIPAGPPQAPDLSYPVNMTGLPQTGFNLTWIPNPSSGPVTYYKVYMWTDAQGFGNGMSWTTTSTSLNPVYPPAGPLGNPQTGIVFTYLTRYYWTVEAYSSAYPDQMAWPDAGLFWIGSDPRLSIPHSETFAGSSFPSAWTQSFSGGLTSNRWSVSSSTNAGGNSSEMKCAHVNKIGLSRLISPPLNTTSLASFEVTFKHKFNDFGAGCTAKLQYSHDLISWYDTEWSVASGSGNASGSVSVTVSGLLSQDLTYLGWSIDGDHFHFNDWYVDNVSLSLSPSTEITIGAGTSSNYEPLSSQWGYQRSSDIYLARELGGSGVITEISFKSSTSSSSIVPIKVYMKMITEDRFLSYEIWPTQIAGLRPVFEGTVFGTNTNQWKTIKLTTPFHYSGNNLKIMIESNYGGTGDGGVVKPQWYYHSAQDRHHYNRKDNTAPTTELGVVDMYRPDIRVGITDYTAYPPVFLVSPASVNFGNVSINTSSAYRDITVINDGGSTINISSIALGGNDSAGFLLNMNSNPSVWALPGGSSKTVKVAFKPAAGTNYSAYLRFSCGALGDYDVALTGTGSDPNTITSFPSVFDFGTTTAAAYPPLGWTKHSGVLASPTILGAAGTGSWIQDDWKNQSTPANKAARINIASTNNGWLISPPINVPAAGYEVRFDLAYMGKDTNGYPQYNGADDQFAVLIGNTNTWTPANIRRKWDNAGSPYILHAIPPSGMSVSLSFPAAGTYRVAFYGASTEPNANNDLMLDNVTLRQTPATPLITTPFFEGFETGNTDQSTNIQDWIQAIGPVYTTQYWKANTTTTGKGREPRTGAWNACLRYSGQSCLIRPIELTAGADYYIEFYARQGSDVLVNANIQAVLGTEPSLDVMTTSIIPQTSLSDGDYQRFFGVFSVLSTGTYYIGIQGWINSSAWNVALDDITIDELPQSPNLSYTPDSIDFGNVAHGVELGPKQVSIANNGGGILNISAADISIIGSNPAEFSFDTSILPIALSTGQSIDIPVYVTASTVGYLEATLRINNDQNRRNYDILLSANGLPAGTVIIGDGSSKLNLPISSTAYSYSQSIFLQSEINAPNQRIDKVYYYWNGVGEAAASNAWTIYMAHTTMESFPTGTSWIPLANLSQVFQGEVPLPATAGWIEIPLDIPFLYNNTDNLVIAVDENEPGDHASAMFFHNTATSTYRSIRCISADSNPNPAAPPFGTRTYGYPNVKLSFIDPASELPMAPILVSPVALTRLPLAGIELRWRANIYSSPIDYYKVYLWEELQGMGDAQLWCTTGTSLDSSNPALDPWGNPQTAFTFDYSQRYFWTVEAYSGAHPTQMAWAEPSWFMVEANPYITTFPYRESFESTSFPPLGWSILDADADAYGWMSWGNASAAHTGYYSAASASWKSSQGDINHDNWLITAPIVIPDTGDFSVEYYVSALSVSNFTEHYSFYVSSSGTAPADFTLLHEETLLSANWEYRMFSLASYAGQTVHFAFRHHDSQGGSFLKIDDVTVRIIPEGPALSYTPSSWDFGSSQSMNPSSTKNFVLSNRGIGSITLNSGDITMNDPEGNFVLTTIGLPVSLSEFATYTFKVQFIPQSVGSKTAIISIQDHVSRIIHTIYLSGEGLEEPIIGVWGLSGEALSTSNVSLKWAGIYGNPGQPGYLQYDDSIPRNLVGTEANTSLNAAIKFGSESMASSAGMVLSSVMIYLVQAPQDVDYIKVWSGSDAVLAPTTLVYQQAVNGLSMGWNTIALSNPVVVSGNSALYVGYHLTASEPSYTAAVDGLYPVSNRGNLVELEGWGTLMDYNLIGNWLIHAYFEAAPAKQSEHSALAEPTPVVEQHADAAKIKLRKHTLVASPNPNAERVLRGFNVYRNGVQINSSPVQGYSYLDEDLAPGSYSYAVQAVHYSANGLLSNTISVTVLPPPAPFALPFTETWASGNFTSNKWSVAPGNWQISSAIGTSAPSASFNGEPEISNYSSVLRSHNFDATGKNSVQFSFDLNLLDPTIYAENVMTWQIWNGTSWKSLGSYNSLSGGLPWTHYDYDVSAYASNRLFKIRFVATGADSEGIISWYIDNITLSSPVPVAGLNLQRLGSNFRLSWTARPGTSWYNVYVSEDPQGGFVHLNTSTNTQIDLPSGTMPAEKAFFKVTAGIGPLPTAAKLFGPAPKP